MRYKGKVYRPPSEAYSLIVQVTYGCSHNGCAFCDMYDDKHFAIRPMEEVREDFEMARRVYKKVERVFLADGDALMRKTEELSQILGLIYGLFPECQRVTCYASPTSLQIKSEEDLRLLRSQGLTMVYMGLESGCDAVLERMRKGHMSAEIVAGRELNASRSSRSSQKGSPVMEASSSQEYISSTTAQSSVPRMGLFPARHSSP